MSNSIDLNTFADGALQEKFNLELEKVLANLQDPNSDYKKPRELTMKIKFVTDEARDISIVTISTSSKLVPSKDAMTKLLMGMDGRGGFLAAEYKNQVPGQQVMRVNGGEVVDIETGEIKEDTASNVRALYK